MADSDMAGSFGSTIGERNKLREQEKLKRKIEAQKIRDVGAIKPTVLFGHPVKINRENEITKKLGSYEFVAENLAKDAHLTGFVGVQTQPGTPQIPGPGGDRSHRHHNGKAPPLPVPEHQPHHKPHRVNGAHPHKKKDRDKDRDKERDKHRDREHSKDRHHKHRDKDRDRHRDKDHHDSKKEHTSKSVTPKAITPKAITPKSVTPKAATPKPVTPKEERTQRVSLFEQFSQPSQPMPVEVVEKVDKTLPLADTVSKCENREDQKRHGKSRKSRLDSDKNNKYTSKEEVRDNASNGGEGSRRHSSSGDKDHHRSKSSRESHDSSSTLSKSMDNHPVPVGPHTPPEPESDVDIIDSPFSPVKDTNVHIKIKKQWTNGLVNSRPDNHLKVRIPNNESNQQAAAMCVESIMQEMSCDELLTGIVTPRKEDGGFPFHNDSRRSLAKVSPIAVDIKPFKPHRSRLDSRSSRHSHVHVSEDGEDSDISVGVLQPKEHAPRKTPKRPKRSITSQSESNSSDSSSGEASSSDIEEDPPTLPQELPATAVVSEPDNDDEKEEGECVSDLEEEEKEEETEMLGTPEVEDKPPIVMSIKSTEQGKWSLGNWIKSPKEESTSSILPGNSFKEEFKEDEDGILDKSNDEVMEKLVNDVIFNENIFKTKSESIEDLIEAVDDVRERYDKIDLLSRTPPNLLSPTSPFRQVHSEPPSNNQHVVSPKQPLSEPPYSVVSPQPPIAPILKHDDVLSPPSCGVFASPGSTRSQGSRHGSSASKSPACAADQRRRSSVTKSAAARELDYNTHDVNDIKPALISTPVTNSAQSSVSPRTPHSPVQNKTTSSHQREPGISTSKRKSPHPVCQIVKSPPPKIILKLSPAAGGGYIPKKPTSKYVPSPSHSSSSSSPNSSSESGSESEPEDEKEDKLLSPASNTDLTDTIAEPESVLDDACLGVIAGEEEVVAESDVESVGSQLDLINVIIPDDPITPLPPQLSPLHSNIPIVKPKPDFSGLTWTSNGQPSIMVYIDVTLLPPILKTVSPARSDVGPISIVVNSDADKASKAKAASKARAEGVLNDLFPRNTTAVKTEKIPKRKHRDRSSSRSRDDSKRHRSSTPHEDALMKTDRSDSGIFTVKKDYSDDMVWSRRTDLSTVGDDVDHKNWPQEHRVKPMERSKDWDVPIRSVSPVADMNPLLADQHPAAADWAAQLLPAGARKHSPRPPVNHRSHMNAASPESHHSHSSPRVCVVLPNTAQSSHNAVDSADPPLPASTYLESARTLKHRADAESELFPKSVTYMEAVLSFLQCGNAMENGHEERTDPKAIYSMYSETLKLVRHSLSVTWSDNSLQIRHICKFRGHQDTDGCNEKERKLAVLSARIQSLLHLKLYKLKRAEANNLKRALDDFNTGKTGNKPPAAQAPSPYQSSWNARSTGTPSPISPQPSPAGSVASVSSVGSNNGDAGRGGMSNGACSTGNVSIPQRIHHVTKQYLEHMHNLHQSHDIWEQADSAQHSRHQDFFELLDRDVGALSLHSSIPTLVRYVKTGLHRLKDT